MDEGSLEFLSPKENIYVTTGKTRKVDSLSKVNKRVKAIETAVGDLVKSVEGSFAAIQNRLDEKNALPIAEPPDARIQAIRESRDDGKVTNRQRVVDLGNPRASSTGFQPDDVVELLESSPKYKTYKVDASGVSIPPIQEAIPAQPALRATDGSVLHTAIPAIQAVWGDEGFPAQGIVLSYLYTKRNGLRKYKVHFPGFTAMDGGKEGILENEMKRCLT
jgi:hypothetical protein|tara:strand:- start:645 stop:1301 length:657 start_codon:yes stop_codon:yes gene_type:complete